MVWRLSLPPFILDASLTAILKLLCKFEIVWSGSFFRNKKVLREREREEQKTSTSTWGPVAMPNCFCHRIQELPPPPGVCPCLTSSAPSVRTVSTLGNIPQITPLYFDSPKILSQSGRGETHTFQQFWLGKYGSGLGLKMGEGEVQSSPHGGSGSRGGDKMDPCGVIFFHKKVVRTFDCSTFYIFCNTSTVFFCFKAMSWSVFWHWHAIFLRTQIYITIYISYIYYWNKTHVENNHHSRETFYPPPTPQKNA